MTQFDAAKAIFAQADTNHDGGIDQNEFRKWATGATGAEILNGGLPSSSCESSGGFDATSAGLAFGTGGYEASSAGFNSQTGFESAGVDNSFTTTSLNSSQQVTDYSSQSTGGLYNDPNPQVVRRAAVGGAITYKQNIVVRFLQPPAVPPPGPLIIKEVRPPQPPPPPPLIVRQKARPLPQPPPLILRERPPIPPATVASQTVIRRLAAIPIPPRSVIIERLPPLPPKPRDIIIERWIPYGAAQKRKTIVQRAAPAVPYPKPRNVIIVYDPVQARVIRQFQRLGVTPENPQAYLARHGASLLDASSLVRQARSAGVIEDISPPKGSFSAQYSSDVGLDLSSGLANQSFSASGATGFEGLQVAGGAETGTYGLDVGGSGGASYSSESLSSSSSFSADSALADSMGIRPTGFDAESGGFPTADTNHDGNLNQNDFQRFYQAGL